MSDDVLAIIIPYRDRASHLEELMRTLYPVLPRNTRIIVCEQSSNHQFNRGAILNAGFRRAMQLGVDRVIFHDCDLVPCRYLFHLYLSPWPKPIVHFGCRFKRYNNDPRYFGGVIGFEVAAFPGFSNRFYGWGGEDDSLRTRVQLRDVYYPEMGTYNDLEGLETARDKLRTMKASDKCMKKREILRSERPELDNANTLNARIEYDTRPPPGVQAWVDSIEWLTITLRRRGKYQTAGREGHRRGQYLSRVETASPPRFACTPSYRRSSASPSSQSECAREHSVDRY